MDPEKSSMESSFVAKLITPFLELFLGKGNVTEHLVRKMAHFTEFSALGLELLLFFNPWHKRFLLPTWNGGLIAALIDETIQIFSGRGDAVPDVWLDFSGVIFGSLIASLIVKLINISKRT